MTGPSNSLTRIDRDSPIPVYQQIVLDITNRIACREWEIGDRLPSENALADSYKVSRVTLRQALAALETDNVIKRSRGQGTFITTNPTLNIEDLKFPTIYAESDDPAEAAKPSTRPQMVRLAILTEPVKDVCYRLNLSPDEKVVYIQRLFYRNKRAIGINNVWLPEKWVPGLAEEGLIDQSVSKTLSLRYQLEVHSIENYIESINLDAAGAQMLKVAYNTASLKIDSIYLLADGIPVEFSSTIWAGDATRFHFVVSGEENKRKRRR